MEGELVTDKVCKNARTRLQVNNSAQVCFGSRIDLKTPLSRSANHLVEIQKVQSDSNDAIGRNTSLNPMAGSLLFV